MGFEKTPRLFAESSGYRAKAFGVNALGGLTNRFPSLFVGSPIQPLLGSGFARICLSHWTDHIVQFAHGGLLELAAPLD